jgi:hypothetical protein
VVFFCTAITYLVTTVPEVWRMLTWKDGIKVIDLISPGHIVLANIGDGDVFVRKLYWTGTVTGITHEVSSTNTVAINKKLTKMQGIETMDLKRPETKKKEFEGEYLKSNELSNEQRMQLWNKARSSDDHCWDIKIQLTKTESMLETERAGKQEFWSIPLQGIVYFDSLHENRTLEQKVDLLGFVVKNTNGKCL